jgi:uncharacterized protein YfaP (DUF2135 family)
MKTLSLLLTLILSFNCVAVAPYGIKGQNQSQTLYSNVHQTPNNQVTNLGGINALIETGNKNILENPGFEHSLFSTGWIESGTGTDTAELSVVIDGKKSFKTVTSAQTINISQSSTLYAAQFADGIQGLASIRIKTNHTGAMSVCSINAGVVSTTNCVTVIADNKWGLYKVPFVLGATSNGISIVGASGTGTTYFDDAFVGAQDITQNAQSISTQYGRLSLSGTTASGAKLLGALTESSGSGLFSYNSATGDYTALVTANFTIAGSMRATTTTRADPTIVVNGNQVGRDTTDTAVATAWAGASFSGIITAGQVFYIINQGTGASDNAYSSVSAVSLANASIYSSQCGANCVDTFSAKVSSSGVISDENIDFLSSCSFGSTGLGSCTFTSGIFTVAPNCAVTYSGAGTGANARVANIRTQSASSIEYLTEAASLTNASINIICQKQGADFTNTRAITGSFKEVMTVPGITKPKTCFYGFGGASATLSAPTECSTGTCVETLDTCGTGTPPSFSSTGIYTGLTFASGTFANSSFVKCDTYAASTSNGSGRQGSLYFATGQQTWAANASGGYVSNVLSYNGGTLANAYFMVECKGQVP